MAINKVMLSGNITSEPELKQGKSGLPILAFGIAVNDRIKRGDNWEDKPNFFDCYMFGDRAAKIKQYLSKGSKVVIEGKLNWHQWEDKQGNKRSSIDVKVEDIELMDGKKQQASQAPAPAAQRFAAPAPVFKPQDAYASEDFNF